MYKCQAQSRQLCIINLAAYDISLRVGMCILIYKSLSGTIVQYALLGKTSDILIL